MKKQIKSIFVIVLSSALLVGMVSCKGKSKKEETNTEESKALVGDIKIDGSSTVYPITEATAEEFRAIAPDVKVTIGSSGSGAGFKKFIRKEIDISDASRGIKDQEVTSLKEAGIGFTEITVAYDGLAIIANPENNWLTNITTEELHKIAK